MWLREKLFVFVVNCSENWEDLILTVWEYLKGRPAFNFIDLYSENDWLFMRFSTNLIVYTTIFEGMCVS